jgi:hypothetical protein
MNRDTIKMFIRATLMLLVQVVVLKRLGLSESWLWQHGHVFLYPVIILLIPFRMVRHYVIILGFAIGLLIDIFYDTVGVHAFALTGMAYARGILLAWLEPRGGYTLAMSPTARSMGMNWLLIYTAVSLGIFCFMYFVAEIFTFVFIGQILLKTVITFVLSMIAVMGYHMLFNPKR